jgi:hypothetical protein
MNIYKKTVQIVENSKSSVIGSNRPLRSHNLVLGNLHQKGLGI